MSKKITIPEYKNPFTVIINNKVYVYKGGETIEVTDDVAEAIEDALELVPKPKRHISLLAQLLDKSIEEVKAGDLVGATSISENSFKDCQNLIRVDIPTSVINIDYNVFSNCTRLNSIIIGDGVTSIVSSFGGCNNLTEIVIGSSVINISAYAFGGLTPELNSVTYTFKPTKPPSIWVDTYSLHQPKYIKKIIVPRGSAAAYKSDAKWAEYTSLIVESGE